MSINNPNKINNKYFKHSGACYDGENSLYNSLLNETYSKFGVKCQYYIIDYDTQYDELFGEDENRSAIRSFPVMIYFIVPPELEMFSQFGIEGVDNFEMYVAISHFECASKLIYTGDTRSGEQYSSYKPSAGDIIKSNYNSGGKGFFYEILEVKDSEEQFLCRQHTYTFIVRKYQVNHISLSADTSATMPELQELDVPDILEINDVIDTENEDNTTTDWW